MAECGWPHQPAPLGFGSAGRAQTAHWPSPPLPCPECGTCVQLPAWATAPLVRQSAGRGRPGTAPATRHTSAACGRWAEVVQRIRVLVEVYPYQPLLACAQDAPGVTVHSRPGGHCQLFVASSKMRRRPPRTAFLDGARALSESWIGVGCAGGGGDVQGCSQRPADAAPAGASGKFAPVARNIVSLEQYGQYVLLISAVVSYRSPHGPGPPRLIAGTPDGRPRCAHRSDGGHHLLVE